MGTEQWITRESCHGLCRNIASMFRERYSRTENVPFRNPPFCHRGSTTHSAELSPKWNRKSGDVSDEGIEIRASKHRMGNPPSDFHDFERLLPVLTANDLIQSSPSESHEIAIVEYFARSLFCGIGTFGRQPHVIMAESWTWEATLSCRSHQIFALESFHRSWTTPPSGSDGLLT